MGGGWSVVHDVRTVGHPLASGTSGVRSTLEAMSCSASVPSPSPVECWSLLCARSILGVRTSAPPSTVPSSSRAKRPTACTLPKWSCRPSGLMVENEQPGQWKCPSGWRSSVRACPRFPRRTTTWRWW